MKKLIILFLLLPFTFLAKAQQATTAPKETINWITWNEVEAKMAKEPRKVLVDVNTSWCGPCKMMARLTFTDPEVVKYVNEHYYAINFDAEGPDSITFKGTTYRNQNYDPSRTGRNGTHDLTMAIAPVNGKIAYPTIVYMDEDFKILSPVQGYLKPDQIMPILKYFGNNAYKTETWEQYTKAD